MNKLFKYILIVLIGISFLNYSCHTYVDVPIGHGPVHGGVSIQTHDPGIAALTLLGVLIGTAMVYDDSSDYNPSYCSVKLNINPGHAKVFLDQVYIGMADEFNGKPEKLSVLEGKHSLLFKAKGYKDYITSISMRNGMKATVTKSMIKIPKAEHYEESEHAEQTSHQLFEQLKLQLDVQPENAEISVDGTLVAIAKELNKLHGPLVIDGNSKKITISYKTEHETYDLYKLAQEQGNLIRIKIHFTKDKYE